MKRQSKSSTSLALWVVLAAVPAWGQGAPINTFYTHTGAEKLYRQAKYNDAEAMCKQAITDIEKARGAKAYQIAEPLIDLATVYMRLARFSDAKQVLDRAESLLDKNKPEQALLYGRLGINKGWRLYTMGEIEAATKVFEESRAIIEKNQKGDSIDLAEIINNLGLMYAEIGDKEEDDALMRKARICLLRGWESRRQLTGEASFETAESLNNLGSHFLFNPRNPSDIDLGLSTLKKSLEVAIKAYGENHPETAMAHATMGLALYLNDDLAEAEKEIHLAIPMTQRFLGDKHPDLAFELSTLGHIQEKHNNFEEAEKKFLEALDIDETVYGKTHPNIVPPLEALKRLYEEKGDAAKAQDVQKRIEKLSGKDL